MASDFKDLFGDEWRPGGESGPDAASSGGERDEPRNLQDSRHGAGESGDGGGGGGGESAGNTNGNGSGRGFTSELENRGPRTLNEKEVKVMGVYIQQEQGLQAQHFVLFRDNRGRLVRIWVGQSEAISISNAIENEPMERPLTHDLMKLMLDKLGATIDRIIIDDLWKETFYAKVTLVKPGGELADIDCRPSDAVAIGLRVKAPIYMAETVLEQSVRSE